MEKGDRSRTKTKKITKDTPKTFKEISKKELKTAQKKKATKGRVDKF